LENLNSHFWDGFPEVAEAAVFIKPNLVSPKSNWDRYSTTDVRVVNLIIQKLIEEKAKSIIVGDCGFKNQWENTIQSTGYYKLMNKYTDKVELISLQDGENFHKFTLKRNKKYLSLYGARLSDYLLACDVVINIPKMKIHTMAGMTGAIKNMMGTMTQKGSMHPRANIQVLHKRLSDLYGLTSKIVDFIVMDGIVGSEYSEQCGLPVKSGVLISGTNQWEVDVAATKLMGLDPFKIHYLRYINNGFDKVRVPKKYVKNYEISLGTK